MQTIDHTAATFCANELTRGYASASAGREVLHARKLGPRKVHVVVHDLKGFYEFTTSTAGSAQRFVDSMADSREA